ncbi:MAG TPA: zf-HC2 domain-containing protein [Pyrinomonadaceae bacterium]|jgi:anti-sigma factor RsiW
MNCEKCQELLSDFLDGALSHEEQAGLSAHFEECLSCFNTHDELNSIVSFCRENRNDYVAPPNERALWLRIRNTIEAEGARAGSAAASASATARRQSWLTRWMNRSWELSFSQMATAVAAIAVAVALATAVGLHRMQNDSTSSTTAAASTSEQRNTSALMNLPVRGLSQEIDYWQQRVDARKVRWNQQRREDFDLNLKVINEAVQERLKDLSENPHDEMTEEMLNAVLNDKVEFLKEFAEL